MATAPNTQFVSVDEYLNSSYEYDMEYVDGELVERSMPTLPHGVLQYLLAGHFFRYWKELEFKVVMEGRTQIVARARYRVPDLLICGGPVAGKVLTTPPWVVIEILSPDDTLKRTQERFRDYTSVGVVHIVLLDPEAFVAYRYEKSALIETKFESLALPNGKELPFNTDEIFAQLREELGSENATT